MREVVIHRLLVPTLLLLTLTGRATAEAPAAFEIYLVRHAEKTTEAQDPGLTSDGAERAAWLAAIMAPGSPSAIWSSDYRRTRQTAAPTAQALGLDVLFYDPRQLEDLAAVLLSRAESALVVGHSNTTPELAALLCECNVREMAESEYDRIIVIRVDGPNRAVREWDSTELRRAEPGR